MRVERRAACAAALPLAVLLGARTSGAQALPSFGNQSPVNEYKATTTEVYRIDFEEGLDAIAVLAPSVTLTTDASDVLEGRQSLKLEGPGAVIALRTDRIVLEPSRVYVVEYRYRLLSSAAPWALGVGFSATTDSGSSTYVPLRGPVAAAGTSGTDARSARPTAPGSTFLFHTWDGSVVIDDIRVLVHDADAHAVAPPVVANGFPRLANYSLLAPDTVALINGVPQEDVERVGARYDLMLGTSIDHTLGAAAWVRRLHGRNPSLRLLPYKQAFMAQFDSGVDGSGLNLAFTSGLRPDWFMRRPSGEVLSEPAFPQNVQLNHTPFCAPYGGMTVNTYTAEFLSRSVLPSGLWSGVHFDQPEWYINPLLGTPPPAVDLDGDGAAEPVAQVQHAWALGFFDYFRMMARRLGSAPLLFGNAGHIPGNPLVLPLLNGWEGEVVSPYAIVPGGDWNTNEPSRWYRLLNNYLLATTYARAPQIVSLQFTGRELGVQTGGVTANGYPQRTAALEARDFRRMRLGLGTALLGNGFYEYDLVDNTTPPQWFDEYSVNPNGVATTDPSGKGWLGQPLGPAAELEYPSREVFRLDFEGPAPDGVMVGPGTISTNPAEVIAGTASLVVRQQDVSEGKWLFYATPALEAGRTYQLFADYRILEYHPSTFAGLVGIGFPDGAGQLTPERSASLYLPDTGAPGQQGTLRASVKLTAGGTPVLGGLPDTGAIAIDNVRLVEGTGGVWRRDFENGIVLVNPTPEPLFVSQALVAGTRARTGIDRLTGSQVPSWNDGSPVVAGLLLPPGDAILLHADHVGGPSLSAPSGIHAYPSGADVTLAWTPAPGYVAGYTVRYGEQADHLTRAAAAGPLAYVTLVDLQPGASYVVEIVAHDFSGESGPPATFLFTAPGPATLRRPRFDLSAVTPAVVPGSVVILEGTDLADATGSGAAPFPPVLAGTRVQVNGEDAALLSVSSGSITFIAPWNIGGANAVVNVVRSGVPGVERLAPMAAARPWVLTWPSTDVAIALHADGRIVSADAPAAPGEAIDVLAVGLGAVYPHPATGAVAAGPHAQSVASLPDMRIDGIPAVVSSAALLAGEVATYTVRVSIPATAAPGLVTVEVNVPGTQSNAARVLVQ